MDPCEARTSVVRAPHGNLYSFRILWDLYVGRAGAKRELTQPEFAKIPHGRRVRTELIQAPYGPHWGYLRGFTISKHVRGQ